MNTVKSGFCLVLAGLLYAAAGSARADDPIAEASASQLIKALDPGYSATRGLRIETTPVAVNSFGDALSATVNLAVEFEFNSATLTARAETLLSELAAALNAPELAAYRFLVGGHTDAVGSEDFNLSLSERRAAATRDFLVERYTVAPERLVVRAFGKTALLLPDKPEDGRNRRVEISTLR